MHIGQYRGLPPTNITQAQIKRVKTSAIGLLTAYSAPGFLGVPAPRSHSDINSCLGTYIHVTKAGEVA